MDATLPPSPQTSPSLLVRLTKSAEDPFNGHNDGVLDCAFSPDGQLLVSASNDGTLRVWDVDGEDDPRLLQGHDQAVTTCAFSPDGRFLISGSHDETLQLWETASWQARKTYRNAGGVAACEVSRDGTLILSAALGVGKSQNVLQLWRLHTDSYPDEWLDNSPRRIIACAYSPSGKYAVTAEESSKAPPYNWNRRWKSRLVLWDPNTLDADDGIFWPSGEGITRCCAISPDERYFLMSSDQTLRLWEVDKDDEADDHEADDDEWAALDHLEQMLSRMDEDEEVGESERTFAALGGDWGISDYVLERHTATRRARVRLALVEGISDYVLKGHTATVTSCSFSADGRYVLSGALDGTMRLWDIEHGDTIRVLGNHASGITACALSPNGQFAVSSGSADGSIEVWNVQTGESIRTFRGHHSDVVSCVFTPDSKHVLSAAQDGTPIIMWDVATGREVRLLRGHKGFIMSCVLSRDGRYALSASRDMREPGDNSLRLWDVATARELAQWRVDRHLTCCAFHPDGMSVMAGDDNVAGDDVGVVHFLQIQGLAKSEENRIEIKEENMMEVKVNRDRFLARVFSWGRSRRPLS